MKPKILMLTLGHGRSVAGGIGGGTETSGRLMVDKLKEKGFDIVVVGNGGDVSFSCVTIVWRAMWCVNAFLYGISLLALGNFNVIYSRYSTYPLFVGFLLKLFFGKPLIASIHGGDIRHKGLFGMIVSFCLKGCDVVVCYDNPEHEEELRRRGIRPFVIPNGVDTGVFKPRKRKHLNDVVLYMGGKREIKGYYDFLSAASSDLLAGSKKLSIHIYDDKTIKGSGKYNSVNNFTEHFDPVEPEFVNDIMETGQLFVLPSHHEGVPGALLQAMSSGMYVIASDLPFTRKVIGQKFLFKAGDVDGIVKLIIQFRDNKGRYFRDQAERNRDIIVRNYSIDRAVSMWADLFGRFV